MRLKTNARTHAAFSALSAGLLCTSTAAFAQNSPSAAPVQPAQGEGGQKIADAVATVMANGPAGSATFGSLANAFQIQTDGNDTTATLALSFDRSHPLGEPSVLANGTTRYTFATDTLGIKVSAPLAKDGKPSIFSFDTLGDGTAVSLVATRYVGAVDYRAAADLASLPALQQRLENRCVDARAAAWIVSEAQGDPSKEALARLVVTELRTRIDRLKLERGLPVSLALSELAKPGDERLVKLATAMRSECIENEGDGLLVTYGTAEEKRQGAPGEPRSVLFYGASATVSRQNFAFLQQSPLAAEDISHTAYKVQAYGGAIFGGGRQSLTGSFSYAHKYKPQDEVTLCGPTTIVGQTQCFEGPLGPPSMVKRYTVALEYRQMFQLDKLPGSPSIGIAPRVSYEFESKAALLELPIYFAPDKAGSLNGGLLMAYDTGKDDFAIGLFVGVPFSIFTN